MSIAGLKYRGLSGFFPFYISNESSLTSAYTPRNITGFPLASLCKAFWLAKSVSVTAAITASMDQQFASDGSHVTTSSSVNQPAVAVPLASHSPQSRTTNPGNPGSGFPACNLSSSIISWPYTWSSIFFPSTGPSAPTSGSGNLNLQLTNLLSWFISIINNGPQNVFASKDSSGNYLTAALINIPIPGAQGPAENTVSFVSPQQAPPLPTSSVTCSIKIDGVTIPPFPLFYVIEPGTVISFSASGSVLFDFDTFNN
jgi:hypothetical protein